MSMQGWQALHSLSRDSSVKERRLAPGTTRRVMGYARPYKEQIAWFLGIVVIESVLVVATPLLLKSLVDDGINPKDSAVVVRLALLVALIAILGAGLTLVERWFSARIGEGLIYDLRTEVFSHVLRQPVAFFTRAQTGALVTRLGNDVIGAQQAFTSVLSSVVSNAITLVLIVVAMASLSWPLTLGALALVPFFLVPARLMGRQLASLAHEQMVQNAEVGTRMTERFNVAGALLVKLFGRPAVEDEEYAVRAARVRDIGVRIAVNRSVFFVALTLVASLATAMVYGVGGLMAVGGTLTVGTLLALTALLARLYGPLTAISNVRVDIMTALVSFERVFEVLDLQPLVAEAPDARPVPAGPVRVEVESVVVLVPLGRRGLARLARDHGDRRPAGQRAGAARRLLHRRAGQPGRPRRSERRRQDDDHLARRPAVRPHRGCRSGSTASTCATPDRVAARRRRGRHPGRPPLPRHDPGQPRLRVAGGHRGRHGRGAARRRRCGRSSTRCPPASTRSSATAATGSPAARSSAWPSPGCCSRGRGSSSSTRPRPTSTASPSTPCSGPSTTRCATARPWSSRTG